MILRNSLILSLQLLLLTFLLGLMFFAEAFSGTSVGWLGSATREVTAVFNDSQTQWMVVVSLAVYLVMLLFLEQRANKNQSSEVGGRIEASKEDETQSNTSRPPSPLSGGAERKSNRHEKEIDSTPHPDPLPVRGEEGIFSFNIFNPNLCLCALVVLVLVRYACDYVSATRSMQPLVLLAAIVLGKAAALVSRKQMEDGRWKMETGRMLVLILLALLAAAALCQPDLGREFQYRGVERWNGVWKNPNIFGLLMGTGLVLTFGQFLSLVTPHSSPFVEYPTSNRRICKWALMLALFIVIGLCGFGLFKSYSRGAWLGTLIGLGYLLWQFLTIRSSRGDEAQTEKAESEKREIGNNRDFSRRLLRIKGFGLSCSLCVSWFNKNRLWLAVILVSLAAICFWQFRHTEWRPARRAFSVANPNDFSWRNRVSAWKGAMQMMKDRPLVGFGWGKAESAYREKYQDVRLEEGAAIQMNDFFMLGISAGPPALICFIGYLAMSFRGKKVERLTQGDSVTVSATCRAGAIILLTGFWFDGGLFKLPTATVFWILMEMGRIRSPNIVASAVPPDVESGILQPGMAQSAAEDFATLHLPGGTPGSTAGRMPAATLRWLTIALAGLALALTTINLGTPLLLTSDTTFFLARKFIVPTKERPDFDFLATNSVWQGKKLKVLLEHSRLANYNRQLINWKLDDQIYRDFVLSPTIDPMYDGDLYWRRTLWEFFYPRIRRESTAESAAQIVLKNLRERVQIDEKADDTLTIPEIWRQRICDNKGFQAIYVAALRSVGVPARLDSNGQAEFFDGNTWPSTSPSSL